MAGNIITPNMSLIEPSIGNEPSPTWASDLNTDISILDSHTHAPGSGIPITPSGLNINTDLPFNGNNALSLRSTRYNVAPSALVGANDLACSYAAGANGDLFWNDSVGNQIQITALGGVVGSPGSISGLTSPASATWVSGTSTFVWKSTASLAANMDFATGIFRYPGSYPSPAGTNWIALEVPSAISSGFALTLPLLPAATSFMTLDNSGNIVATIPTSKGIDTANIADGAVTYPKLGALNFVASPGLGSQNNGSTSFVALTGLSVTLTTSGRPVFVAIQPNLAGSSSNVGASSAVASAGIILRINRTGGPTLASWTIEGTLGGSGTFSSLTWPTNQFVVDTLIIGSPGTYTWTADFACVTSFGVVSSVQNVQLVAFEVG